MNLNSNDKQALFHLIDFWATCFVGRKSTTKTLLARLKELYQEANDTSNHSEDKIEKLIDSISANDIVNLAETPELNRKMLIFLESQRNSINNTGKEILDRIRNEYMDANGG